MSEVTTGVSRRVLLQATSLGILSRGTPLYAQENARTISPAPENRNANRSLPRRRLGRTNMRVTTIGSGGNRSLHLPNVKDSTRKLAIQPNDQYGSDTGQYVALGAQSGSSAPVTLQLTTPQSYFGFSWNAGDSNNELFFYKGSQLVGSYSTATILGILQSPTVTALDGQTYQSSAYYGQPVTQDNSGQPYSFVNFIDSNGTFDQVVFGNSNTTGTGFESDNHTIRLDAPTPDGTFVFVGSAVPEPSSVALLISLGLSGTVFAVRRRKCRK